MRGLKFTQVGLNLASLGSSLASVVCVGRVSYLFKNTPTPSGWAGFKLRVDGTRDHVQFVGTPGMPIHVGDRLEIYGREKLPSGGFGGSQYEILDVRKAVGRNELEALFLTGSERVPQPVFDAAYAVFGDATCYVAVHLPDLVGRAVPARSVDKLCRIARTVTPLGVLQATFPHMSPEFGRKVAKAFDLDGSIGLYAVVSELRSNPYGTIMLARDSCGERLFHGKGLFAEVDAFALPDCGIGPSDPMRVKFGIYHAVCSCDGLFRERHCCIDCSEPVVLSLVLGAVRGTLGLQSFGAQELYDAFLAAKDLFRMARLDGRTYVYLKERAVREGQCADALAYAASRPSLFDWGRDRATMSEVNALVQDYYLNHASGQAPPLEAYNFVHNALRHRVSVLTGGPGSGKTTSVRCLLYVIDKMRGAGHKCGLASPEPILAASTGMAARRLADSVNADGGTCAARTIASYVWEHDLLVEQGFDDKLKALMAGWKDRLLIVDETSMVDLDWAGRFLPVFLKACGCQAVFLGDRDQLPSVSYGELFEHMCALGPSVPVTCLTGSNRVSKSAYVLTRNFDCLNQGKPTDEWDWSDAAHFSAMWTTDAASDEVAAGKILGLFLAEHARAGNAAYLSTRILSPVRQGSSLAVDSLNKRFQEALNPSGAEIPGTGSGSGTNRVRLRVGDRVVFTKNANDSVVRGGVVNGDCGFVSDYDAGGDDRRMLVRLDDGSVRTVYSEQFDILELAYATTVHKAQGQECDRVVMTCPTSLCRPGFGVRNLAFTGVTRARREVVLAGRRWALDACVAARRVPRNSLLAYRFRGQVADIR